MPRRKLSKGTVRFSSPVMDEFQRLVFYELANSSQWNPSNIKHQSRGANRWKFVGKWEKLEWSIEYDGKYIHVTCPESTFSLRQGFTFDMGNGRLIINA